MKQKSKKKLWFGISTVSFGIVLSSMVLPLASNSLNNTQNTNLVTTVTNNATSQIAPRATADQATQVPNALTATGDLTKLYPNQLIDSNKYERELKQLLISNITNVVGSTQLRLEDIVIVGADSTPQNFQGSIILSYEIIHRRAKELDASGNIVIVDRKKCTTTISGLLRAIGSNIPSEGQTLHAPDSYAEFNSVNVVSSNMLETHLLPQLIGGTQLPTFRITIKKEMTRYIFPSSLSVTANFNNYYDSTGKFVADSYKDVTFTIDGFKPLVNSNITPEISATSLGIFANELTLENSFDLIKANITNLSRDLTIDDIQNFYVQSDLVHSTADVSFDIVNDLWVEDNVFSRKGIQVKFTGFNQYTGTCINNLVDTDVAEFTTSELKKSAPNDDWKLNTTLKSVISKAVANPIGKLNPIDIEIVDVYEDERIFGDNYKNLVVTFKVIHSKAKDGLGNPQPELELKTTITGFKQVLETSIPQEIIAKYVPDAGSKAEYTVLNNKYANEIDKQTIKTIVARGFNKKVVDIRPNDIEIISSTPDITRGKISVDFNLINKKFVDGSGTPEASHHFTTTIFGFKIFTKGTRIDLVNGRTFNNTNVGFKLPATSLREEPSLLIPWMRTFVTGQVPENFKIEINDPTIDSAHEDTLTFGISLYNTYDNDGNLVPFTSFTGLKLTGLPTNLPTSTYTYPFISVGKNGLDSTNETIESYRSNSKVPGNSYPKIRDLIAKFENTINPIPPFTANDVNIVGDPVFSAEKNTIEVNFEIINHRYNDGASKDLAKSPQLKTTIVGFKPLALIEPDKYAINTIPGQKFSDIYASNVDEKIEEVYRKPGLTKQEILNSIQIILSDYVDTNISNLDPENTNFSISYNNTDTNAGAITGSLQVTLQSSGYYTSPSGTYQEYSTNVASKKIFDFASIKASAKTMATVPLEKIDVFASDVNLNNISKYINLVNVPVGTNPQYVIEAEDVKEINGVPQNYGLVTVRILLDSYFDIQGHLIQGEWTGDGSTLTIKTKPYLNTSLSVVDQDNVIQGKDLKNYIPSSVQPEILKKVIASNLQEKPTDEFDVNKDIDIIKTVANDQDGTILVDFSITNYYQDGVITNVPKEFNDVTITGFSRGDVATKEFAFYEELWFWIMASCTGGALLILLIVFISYKAKRKNDDYDW